MRTELLQVGATLAAVIILGIAVGAVAGVHVRVTMRTQYKGLPTQQVLLGPVTPEAITGSWAKISAADLAPFAAVLRNSAPDRRVVGFGVVFTYYTQAGGVIAERRVDRGNLAAVYGGPLGGDADTPFVRPGDTFLVSFLPREDEFNTNYFTVEDYQALSGNLTLDAMRARELQQLADLARRTDYMVAALDWVLFDDGLVVGPDTAKFYEREAPTLKAEEALKRDVLDTANRGGDVATWLAALEAETTNTLQADYEAKGVATEAEARDVAARRLTSEAQAIGVEGALARWREQSERGLLQLRRGGVE
jgi:hypothetical protein